MVMKPSAVLVRVASNIRAKLIVTISRGPRVKMYYPTPASAARLHRLLAEKTPCSVFIDGFGPSVFYEVEK